MFTQVCWGSRKKQNPRCINYNNPTSEERRRKKSMLRSKQNGPTQSCVKRWKKQLPYPLKWERCVKRTVVWSSSMRGKSALPISHHAFACFPSYLWLIRSDSWYDPEQWGWYEICDNIWKRHCNVLYVTKTLHWNTNLSIIIPRFLNLFHKNVLN